MQRRIFSREYKLEAVKLVRERRVAVTQAARDLDVHENVLHKWVREYGDDPSQSFPGKGPMKPERLEIERLRCEVAKLKAARDILRKRSRASSRLCAVETGGAKLTAGGELPTAYWRHSTPLRNVAHGLLRT